MFTGIMNAECLSAIYEACLLLKKDSQKDTGFTKIMTQNTPVNISKDSWKKRISIGGTPHQNRRT